ncbi:hypothetical protein ANME2D_01098 [Candidatus Methanoperedens nitroreducens]|uniref:HNH domain-containing protein n=1 Tax=Candidatus Methanoperedens nitratireducens TaxID=1392998 RepID=A0A062V5Q5_9EURY|nr:hypothetical protein [Candidatus Methanoperedens nitroreducens]KCZ72667.1 hypothetical protein ANME2D_01098 [Candidatus Methanoperedens nitroreducens]MDJ1423401.1 hypothetical protein [Candidatus Methanoperedens sp.]
MQNQNDRARFAAKIKNKKYIDNYIEKWLELKTLDRPYVECEICGYRSNASIHQHLLIPEEFGLDSSSDNRIIHMCANCHYELRALIDRQHIGMVPERLLQVCEGAFENLKDKKKHYMAANQSLEGIEV